MQISQEVRDFAAKKEAGLLNSTPTTQEQAEAGMAQMSERYNEGGRELYIDAGVREHD